MKKKLNVLLLISFVLGALYLLYSVYYWGGAGSSGTTAYRAGAAIATYLVMPHLALPWRSSSTGSGSSCASHRLPW